MNNENQDQRKYKRYDENFKRSAVELWLQGGKTVEAIAASRSKEIGGRIKCAGRLNLNFAVW